ncbi:hypothetical protein GMJAKD_02135 [Candidatus Electrothrix aarhusensis]
MKNEYPCIFVPEYLASSSDITLQYFVSDGSVNPLSAITQQFVEAGKYGAYALEHIHPAQSSIFCQDYGGERSTIFVLKTQAITPNAFQILRNMASRLSLDETMVSKIEISSEREARKKELPVPDEENEEDVYPTQSDKIGFRVNWEDSDFAKSRRMLVEMRTQPEPDAVYALQDYVKPWYEILEAGGFALPVGHPAETECIAGMVTQFDEFSCEIAVDRFLASETAWNVLVNMIGHYSQNVSPVSQVMID